MALENEITPKNYSVLWLLKNDKILTNRECLKRRIRSDDLCKSCLSHEDSSHIFRDCYKAKQVWNIIDPNFVGNTGDTSFSFWLDTNLKSKISIAQSQFQWCILFVVIIWNLWKNRNDFQFNNVTTSPDQIVIKSRLLTEEIHKAFDINYGQTVFADIRLIKWLFPPTDIV